MENTEEDMHTVMHSYAKKSLNDMLESNASELAAKNVSLAFQETPKPKSKKSKIRASDEDGSHSEPVSNSHLLKIMERIEKMQEESLRRMYSLEVSVKDNTNSIRHVTEAIEFVGKQVEDVKTDVESLKSKVCVLEKHNEDLRDKCSELDAYKRRWNLRVAGMPEKKGENVRKDIIDLLRQVSPEIAGQLAFSVDVVHRLGPRSDSQQFNRRIIVQFLSRAHRDKVWRDAKNAKILSDKNIKIFEDLTQDIKDARKKLWPMVEKARKEGKQAGFRGSFAYIEGHRVTI